MPAEAALNVAGTWRLLDAPEINVAGVWKEIVEIELNVSGTWRTVYEVAGVSLIGADWGAAPAPPTTTLFISSFTEEFTSWVYFIVYADGRYARLIRGIAAAYWDWATDSPSTVGGDYQVKFVKVSGDDPSTSTVAEGVWQVLNTDFELYMEDTQPLGLGDKLGYFDVSIRYGTDDATIVTRRIGMSVEYTQNLG